MKIVCNTGVIQYSPSYFPFLISIAIFPVILPLIVAVFMSWQVAIISFFIGLFLSLASFLQNPITHLGIPGESSQLTDYRGLNAIGVLDFVRLSPDGIEHAGWRPKPFRHKYQWHEVHSLRLHTCSPASWVGNTMIAFTPVDPSAQDNYRCPFTGVIGVRAFGDAEEMLATMIGMHQRYSATGFPSAWDPEYSPRVKERMLAENMRFAG